MDTQTAATVDLYTMPAAKARKLSRNNKCPPATLGLSHSRLLPCMITLAALSSST